MDKKISCRLNRLFLSFFQESYINPVDYAIKKIDFKYDKGASQPKFIPERTPYLIPVLQAWDFKGKIKEITVCAPERTGKTLSWMMPLIGSFETRKGNKIVVYQNQDMCQRVNEGKLLPLMRAIPNLSEQLARPHSTKVAEITLADSTLYFMGSGSPVTCLEAQICVADELDEWIDIYNLTNLRKRVTTYSESLLVKVCTPQFDTGPIWTEFLNSSMGYWHLRCLGCGELTIASWDMWNLKFEHDVIEGEKVYKKDTAYLECPKCKHQHNEADRFQMNLTGGYIHEKPELVETNVGFQWGGLASPEGLFCFDNLAKFQLLAGRSGNIDDQKYFFNSIKGKPLVTKDPEKMTDKRILSHIPTNFPDVSILEAIFVSIDSQGGCFKWQMTGLDINSCRWVLKNGACQFLEKSAPAYIQKMAEDEKLAKEQGLIFTPEITIEDVLYKDYDGLQPLLAIIDEGGTRKREVFPFVQKHEKLYSYKGKHRTQSDKLEKYFLSENQPKLFIAFANEYQADFLWYIYDQKIQDNNFWWFSPNVDKAYLDEISAIQPDLSKRNGRDYEEWDYGSRVHDWFDVSKMYLCIEDIAIKNLDKSYFKHGKASILGLKPSITANEDTNGTQLTAPESKSWVSNW